MTIRIQVASYLKKNRIHCYITLCLKLIQRSHQAEMFGYKGTLASKKMGNVKKNREWEVQSNRRQRKERHGNGGIGAIESFLDTKDAQSKASDQIESSFLKYLWHRENGEHAVGNKDKS